MDILYLLIPVSALLVLAILAVFGWALHDGQFDDLEQQGARILDLARADLDRYQTAPGRRAEESVRPEAFAEQSR